MSDSLQPRGLQHARHPCPSPTPGACSNSYPLSRWCHPTTSSSVVPFSSHLQSFPASGSFPMSQLFTWGGQSIGISASASVLPMNIQDWFPLGWTLWISLQSKGLSRVFSNTTVQKHQFFGLSFLHSPTLTSIHNYWKNHSFEMDLCWQSNVKSVVAYQLKSIMCIYFSNRTLSPRSLVKTSKQYKWSYEPMSGWCSKRKNQH